MKQADKERVFRKSPAEQLIGGTTTEEKTDKAILEKKQTIGIPKTKPNKRNTPAVRKDGQTENKSASVITVPLTVNQREALEKISIMRQITTGKKSSLSEVMREALDDYIKKNGKLISRFDGLNDE